MMGKRNNTQVNARFAGLGAAPAAGAGAVAQAAPAAHAAPAARKPLRIAGFNPFEFGMVSVVAATSLYFFAMAAAPAIAASDAQGVGYAGIDLIAAVSGICSVVLCAKGKRSGFIFGLVNALGYAFIAFHNQYFGEVMLNVLFYVPANIVSYGLWTRHKDERRGGKEVKGRALSIGQLALACVVVAGATVGYHFVLQALGGAMTMLDGASTVLSIFATILMALRYSEQWFFWIVVDVITVALWCFAGDPIMIAMWGTYLVNAVYGYLMWLNKCGRRVPLKRLLDRAAR